MIKNTRTYITGLITKIKIFIRRVFLNDFMLNLTLFPSEVPQMDHAYLEWLHTNLVEIINEFVRVNKIEIQPYLLIMNRAFSTSRFNLLLKKWLVEYLVNLFKLMHLYSSDLYSRKKPIVLEDNPLHRLAAKHYSLAFNIKPQISWRKRQSIFLRIASIVLTLLITLFKSINRGILLFKRKKTYKVMREALWGLPGRRGLFFHDDFLVDGKTIKKEDLLLFSRGMNNESSRIKAFEEVKNSDYAYFNLPDLAVSCGVLLSRVLPRYIFSIGRALFSSVADINFSLFHNITIYFINYALPYEKIFSHYRLHSELGHNYFSANHIAEAIVCQNYGVKYYLMHWSDLSEKTAKLWFAFLGCDHLLLWGDIHGRAIGIDHNIAKPVGYVFKRFINEVRSNRIKAYHDMGIKANGKVIAFFDESFGDYIEMTELHYVNFWETALLCARRYPEHTVIIKPKGMHKYQGLSDGIKPRYLNIRHSLEELDNVYIVDPEKWTFIEVIGIADLVITQGVTSSSIIALICGINGLFFDQFGYDHELSKRFKNKLVFNEPDALLKMVNQVLMSDLKEGHLVPDQILREYDSFADDSGLERFRELLTAS